jgi:hypothetical protein
MMLFFADVGVKVNRRTLLCKRSGGERARGRTEVRSASGTRARDPRKKILRADHVGAGSGRIATGGTQKKGIRKMSTAMAPGEQRHRPRSATLRTSFARRLENAAWEKRERGSRTPNNKEVSRQKPYGYLEGTSTGWRRSSEQRLMELDHLGNGPDMMGPESTASQARLQWAHWTSRAADSLAPEWVSNATEFLFWQ